MTEEKDLKVAPAAASSEDMAIANSEDLKTTDDSFEVFKKGDGQVDFRTVSWLRASAIFLKMLFATGILSIPSVMYDLGAFPGAVNLVGSGAINTYGAVILGNFRNKYPQCHSVADMAQLSGGMMFRELIGFMSIVTYVITAASGVIGVSASLNALSVHATCTVWLSLVATVTIAMCASVRKFSHVGWLTWVGFFSALIASSSSSTQTGSFELGHRVIGNPTFAAGITAATNIFVSSAASSAFLPVTSEMRKPKDYPKAVYLSMGFVTASYLTFSLAIYRWCGKWIPSPALGSAGDTIKRVSYGIALPGLIISGALYIHVAAKYLFVRILRNSKHLQANTLVHWGTWLGCTVSLSVISFALACAIPIFTYVLALGGSVCFARLAISLPGYFWLWSHDHYWKQGTPLQKFIYVLHVLLVLLGLFMTVGGTYGVIVQITKAYESGKIDKVFSCADNSGSIAV